MNIGKVVLVTGGSRSGKSEYAESMLENKNDVLYIATANVTDDEMRERIRKHKQRRNKYWTTYEGYKNLSEIICSHSEESIILDCVTIMVTNLIFENQTDVDNILENDIQSITDKIKYEFENLINTAKANNKELIMVTNEVGCGIVPENKLSRIFRDMAGIINQYIASLSDEVYIVACGLPLRLK